MTSTTISSTVSGNTIGSGDTVFVVSGGIDEDYTLVSGGVIEVGAGGLELSGTLNNYNDVPPPDELQSLIDQGGVASATTIVGGEQIVAGGTTYNVVISGGEQIVSSGGIANQTVMPGDYSNGFYGAREQLVASGGQAIGTVVDCGYQEGSDYAGSIDSEQTVEAGGSVTGSVVSGVLLEYYDWNSSPHFTSGIPQLIVSSGAVASNTTLDFLGEEIVSSGGRISGTTVITGSAAEFWDAPTQTSGGILVLNGTAGSGSIDFEGPGTLVISGTAVPANEITHITPEAVIDLASIAPADVTAVEATADQLVIETTSGAEVLEVDGADSRQYVVASDGHGGTELLCYLRGTRILTPIGERSVEDLGIGDLVVTRYSGLQKIRWIGRQSYNGRFLAAAGRPPVRIAAGALGEHLPARGLVVSPGHSMLLATADGEERLVLASALVNGITITQDEPPDEVHYYQVDLAWHDCVIAEGTWSETYGDGDQLRGQFHNVAEFWELYPDHREPDELVLCAPRPERGPKLDQALRPVVLRAMAEIMPGPLSGCIDLVPTPWKVEGWAHDAHHPDLPVLLEVLLGGEMLGTVLACDHRGDLEQARIGRGRCAFAFSSPVHLPTRAMHEIRVRRASDGAEIAMSQVCREQIERQQGKAASHGSAAVRVRGAPTPAAGLGR